MTQRYGSRKRRQRISGAGCRVHVRVRVPRSAASDWDGDTLAKTQAWHPALTTAHARRASPRPPHGQSLSPLSAVLEKAQPARPSSHQLVRSSRSLLTIVLSRDWVDRVGILIAPLSDRKASTSPSTASSVWLALH